MAIRTTIGIPEDLHAAIKRRADEEGVSVEALVVRALEREFGGSGLERAGTKLVKKSFVTGPPIVVKGPLGPRFPTDETPWDLVFADSEYFPK